MAEHRLFPEGTVPEYTTKEWYAGRDNSPHLNETFHRPRLLKSATLVAHAAFGYGLNTVVDLGSGDGGLLSLLGPGVKGWGYDLCPNAVLAAKSRSVDVRQADVLSDPIEWGQVAVCTEMLEHLVDPHSFVQTIADNAQAVVASSPFNESPESHYEFHTWAWDFAGYADMLKSAGLRIIRHEPVGPFQVIMAAK